VDDAASRSFQLVGAVLHVHYMEGFDIGHARREDQICVTLHEAYRSGDLKTDRMGELSMG
jgi:hypothetical protein